MARGFFPRLLLIGWLLVGAMPWAAAELAWPETRFESREELLKALRINSQPIQAVVFSPSGDRLAVAEGKRIEIYDARTWQRVALLEGHEETVTSVAFAPDSARIASGSFDITVRLWDAQSGVALGTLKGHEDSVYSVAFAPDGARIASSSDDKTVRLWDAQSGAALGTLKGHENWVTSVAFAPDGARIASSSDDKTVRLWDAQSGAALGTLKGHESYVTSVAFAPDGQTLVSASADGTIRVWEVLTGQLHGIRVGGRGGWTSCEVPCLRCIRADDGALLEAPLPRQAPTALMVRVREPLRVRAGQAMPFSLRVTNCGDAPGYWIKVRPWHATPNASPAPDKAPTAASPAWKPVCPGQTLLPATPFNLSLPDTVLALDPGEETTIPLTVSGWGCYEQPQEGTYLLQLEVTAHNAPRQILSVPVTIAVPKPEVRERVAVQPRRGWWQRLRQRLGQAQKPRSLAFKLANAGGHGLQAYSLDLRINDQPILAGDETRFKTLAAGAERAFNFVLEDAVKLDKTSRVDLTVRQNQSPLHVWHFHNLPLHVPPLLYPHEIALLLLLILLLAGFTIYLRVFRHPLVVEISREPTALARVPLAELPRARRFLRWTWRLDSVLAQAQVPARCLDQAEGFAQMDAAARVEVLARRLGAESFAAEPPGLRLPTDFPLNLETLRVHFPAPGESRAEIEGWLKRVAPTEKVLIVSLNPAQQTALRPLGEDPATLWIVPDPREITALLIAPQPVPVLTGLLARQLKVAQLSPYQTRSGVNQDWIFFGRTQLLSHILHREPGNYLLCGGRQLGKSSILKRLDREYRKQEAVACHYVILSGADFWTQAGLALGCADREATLAALRAPGKRRILLIDEADMFIRAEAAQNYPSLQIFRALSEEGKCFFILAGFWDLYAASVLDYHSPLKNFGESLIVGALEEAACRQLASEPMANLGLRWESEALVERLLAQTGQRANLIAIACNQILQSVRADQRVLTAAELDAALASDAVWNSLQGWESLDHEREGNRLDRLLVYTTIAAGEFDVKTAMDQLNAAGIQFEADRLKRALERLTLAFVIRRDQGRYRYHVPLLRQFILEDDVAALLAQEVAESSAGS